MVPSGTVASGVSFTIDAASASTLKFTNTATAAAAIAINNANQTLEVGAGGSLTIGAAESITNGTIRLSGGTLTDAAGLTIGTGATLSGFGTVSGAVSGAGTLTANGGTLTANSSVTVWTMTVGGASGGDLVLGANASDSATSLSFAGSSGTLKIGADTSLTVTNAIEVTAGNTLELAGGATLSDRSITLDPGATLSGTGTIVGLVYTSVSYTMPTNLHMTKLKGLGAGGLTLTGNDFDTILVGGAGNDILNSGGGHDTLIGGGGNDTFAFNTTLGGNNVDTIADYNNATDTLQLDHTIFGGLTLGQLTAAEYAIGSPSGSSLFATLTGAPTLTPAHIFVV